MTQITKSDLDALAEGYPTFSEWLGVDGLGWSDEDLKEQLKGTLTLSVYEFCLAIHVFRAAMEQLLRPILAALAAVEVADYQRDDDQERDR